MSYYPEKEKLQFDCVRSGSSNWSYMILNKAKKLNGKILNISPQICHICYEKDICVRLSEQYFCKNCLWDLIHIFAEDAYSDYHFENAMIEEYGDKLQRGCAVRLRKKDNWESGYILGIITERIDDHQIKVLLKEGNIETFFIHRIQSCSDETLEEVKQQFKNIDITNNYVVIKSSSRSSII